MPTLDNVFWLTIGLIFLVTLVGAFVKRLTKDRCLKLLHGYHATFLSEKRPTAWGDLVVTSQGLELIFQEPVVTARGFTKTSALVFDDEYAKAVALCRNAFALPPEERRLRKQQIHRTFNPSLPRRFLRALRNALNTLHDAITRSLTLFVGRFTGGAGAGGGGMAVAVKSQSDELSKVGGSAVSLAANAYEPLLERYVGKEVVLELANPEGTPGVSSFPGYLVDYSAQFVAVFNIEHQPVERTSVRLDTSSQLPWLAINRREDGSVELRCVGEDAVFIPSITRGGSVQPFGATLLPGCSLVLAPHSAQGGTVEVERTRSFDVVAPRTRARIRFGGSRVPHPQKPAEAPLPQRNYEHAV